MSLSSVDHHPWDHPFLTRDNIARFRSYSEQVHDFALSHSLAETRPLSCAFTVNMAQSMYKWAQMAQRRGWRSCLIPHSMDSSAISQPEWEEFDGEFGDILAGDEFLRRHPDIALRAPVQRVPNDGQVFYEASKQFDEGERRPLLRLLAQTQGMRDEDMMRHTGCYPYYAWARALADYQVAYATSSPLAAYFSGTPYSVCSVGGDLQFDAGRSDDLGKLMIRSFNAASFFMISNPHSLGHARRLSLTNGVYLPYPMDSDRYCPGPGMARRRWNELYGDGVYVLTAARLDGGVKGHDAAFFDMIQRACRQRPSLKFVFLRWGAHADQFAARVAEAGLQNQMIMMLPVGKARLIDYYRSCDVVLDQFVYGYYGATALEAAAVGKPVIMRLRKEQYDPLYAGDVAPVFEASTTDQVFHALGRLADDPALRIQSGEAMRSWLVRTHGEARTAPLLLALLRLTADRVPLPKDLVSPLTDPETEAEAAYHAACMVPA